jgi:hypothetical protein
MYMIHCATSAFVYANQRYLCWKASGLWMLLYLTTLVRYSESHLFQEMK